MRHALSLQQLGMMGMQGVAALLAGLVASALGSDARAAGTAVALVAATSLLVTAALTPGLRRSRAGAQAQVLTLEPMEST